MNINSKEFKDFLTKNQFSLKIVKCDDRIEELLIENAKRSLIKMMNENPISSDDEDTPSQKKVKLGEIKDKIETSSEYDSNDEFDINLPSDLPSNFSESTFDSDVSSGVISIGPLFPYYS